MKIAIISDIHGNLPALETVTADLDQWEPDLVVVNGDVVNRGPLSLDCFLFVQAKQQKEGWQVTRGNHEDFVLDCARPDLPRHGPEYELRQFAHWAYEQLQGYHTELAAWPDQFEWQAPDGRSLRAVHGSMRNNRDGVYPDTADDELRAQIAPAPAVFVAAHTHRPLVRQVDETLVVNVGSVGASFDWDRRLSYGRFTWAEAKGWQTEIVRLPYNYRQIEEIYVDSGFLAHGGPFAQLMLVELRRATGLIVPWSERYHKAVMSGAISLEASVRDLLADEAIRPFTGSPGWQIS